VALGLVLVIEGLTYALVPGHMQKMMRQLQELPPERLRVMGTVVLGLGVFVVWLAH
jgi:uncharacterized protein YjeT (DUF2065 family)